MKKTIYTTIATLTMAFLLLTQLCGCGGQNNAAESSESDATQIETGRQDGERFEGTIAIEGFEETVKYEHIRNDAIGIEMDYDYERFERHSESDRERFVSVYEDPKKPEIYLDVTYSAEDADTVAASIGKALSKNYDITKESFTLDRAGDCIRIDASVGKDNKTPDKLQTVYIVPASDGCRVATAHYTFESAEGFGKRFQYIMDTLMVIDSHAQASLTDKQAISAIKKYCYTSNPDLESIVNAGEHPVDWEVLSSDEHRVVVLFSSYTGAQIRYYIDRITGETYVTEFMPGVSSEEERTEESFNVRDYLS